ncbi:hypothetical protein COOONC_21555 [Cooperia oncophora]
MWNRKIKETRNPHHSSTSSGHAEICSTAAPVVQAVAIGTSVPVTTASPLPPPTTIKYVLNYEAAEKYWATATFPTTTKASVVVQPLQDVPVGYAPPPPPVPAPALEGIVNPKPKEVEKPIHHPPPLPLHVEPVVPKPMPISMPKPILDEPLKPHGC